jgi:acyl-homoserine-lactone acylase
MRAGSSGIDKPLKKTMMVDFQGMGRGMKSLKIWLPVTLSFVLSACDLAQTESAEKVMESPPADTAGPVSSADNSHIIWDSWGVPHIFAGSEQDIFFADGWVQMQAHANTILKLYGRSRGRAAEYWGEEYLDSDKLIHKLGHPEMAASQWEQQEPQTRQILTAFVDGMNAYARQHPEAITDDKQLVLPLSVIDVNLHSLFVVNTRFVGARELGQAGNWDEQGSNTYAVGPSHSASGKAMLVQNPHLPWSEEYLFFEKHLKTPEHNIYGVGLVGLPGFAIAFNDFLGWSHTNNTIDNADLYELTLDGEGDEQGYLLDGEHRKFETLSKTILVKTADGTLSEQEIVSSRSVHGPVIEMGTENALALRLVGADRPNLVQQWWRMANAESFDQFDAALSMGQIPFWNVMYADREGTIFYVFNGQVPVRSHGDWDYWQGIIPGDVSENLWTSVHEYADLPKTRNPPGGWLQNANDPPWTSSFPMQLDADNFPAYMAPRGMWFRPQRAVRMMVEDESISFDELIEYKLSTRMELADRILDDLFDAIDEYGSELAQEAKTVLMNWDREANADSKGAALFYFWARRMEPNKQENFAQAWDESHPRTTPDGLADPQGMVRLLEEVATDMKQAHGSLDMAWGEVYRIRYNGFDLPGNGGSGALGIFRVAWPGAVENGIEYIAGGDSWVGIIEFTDKPHARVLLSYGNSSQQDSPHNGDQLELFSRQQFRDAWLSAEALTGHTEKTEWRTGDGFTEK